MLVGSDFRNSYRVDDVLCLKWFDSTGRRQEENIMKLLRFAHAFDRETRDKMSPGVRSDVRRLYNMRHTESVNVMSRADYTRERCWVLLSRNKKTGEILGQTEESFSMRWSRTHVNVIRPYLNMKFSTQRSKQHKFSRADYNKACSDYINERQKLLREQARETDTYERFYARVGSKNCPIKIDWHAWHNRKGNSSWDWRNLQFSLR
ncbi:hypothetical protein VPHF86_0307 [Vibrio phage F86]